jgi:hypothetical protein
MRPVTVAPSSIAAGGSFRPTLTAKVRVTGSAWGATSRRGYLWIVGQAHGNTRIAWRCAEYLCGYVKYRVTSGSSGNSNNHLSNLHDFTGARTDSGDYSRRVRLEFGKADLVICSLYLRLGSIDLRLRSLQCLLGLVVVCARGPALLEQRVLPLEVIAGLRQLTLRRNEVGLRRTQCIPFILRFQTRDYLSGLDPVPELAIVFKHPAGDAECKRYFVLRLDSTGQGDGRAGCALLDRHGPNRARLRCCGICLWRTTRRCEKCQHSQDGRRRALDLIGGARRHGPSLLL